MEKGGIIRAEDYNLFMEKKIKSSVGNRIFVHHRIVRAIKRVELVSDRISYKVLRGRWVLSLF